MERNGERQTGIQFQVRESGTALACGVLAMALAVFVPLMRFLHPAAGGGGAILYLPLLCIFLSGVFCFMLYYNRRVTVEEEKICYVNFLRREKRFTIDEIGYCKVGAAGNEGKLVLHDLCGEKLCKLDFGMRGMAEFYQYLTDNGVETDWNRVRTGHGDSLSALLLAIGRETAVCAEEIQKCTAHFYEEVSKIFRAWETRNGQLAAVWEIGFAEYTAQDTAGGRRAWERESSVPDAPAELPESYECILEAYLKRQDGYVVDSRGAAVVIELPYLAKTRSYRIGEGTRIRRADERDLTDWLERRLAALAGELQRHRYHTETLTFRHRLRSSAGLRE